MTMPAPGRTRSRGALLWHRTGHAGPALLLSTLVLATALLMFPAAILAQPGGLALTTFPDVAGASGESQALFLNPAAATELERSSVGFWSDLPQSDGEGPLYGLAVLDPGITLAGGLVVTYTPREDGEPVSVSYSVAGRLGPAGLGIRPVWTRTGGGQARWTLDAGLAWHLAPWVSLGLSGLDLAIGSAKHGPGRGVAGITFTATPLQETLLEGAQLALGVVDEDLDHDGSLLGRAGLRIPLGHSLRLALGYQYDLESGESAGWGGSLAVSLGRLRLDLGYESNQAYRAALELGW